MCVEVETEAVFVLRFGALGFAAEDDRAEGGVRARIGMCSAARRRRVAEHAGIGIFVVIVAVVLGETERQVKAIDVRVDRRCDLPFLSALAMMRSGDERGVGVVRVGRYAEVEVRVAAGESEVERLIELGGDRSEDRVLAIVVVARETVVLPMLERGMDV